MENFKSCEYSFNKIYLIEFFLNVIVSLSYYFQVNSKEIKTKLNLFDWFIICFFKQMINLVNWIKWTKKIDDVIYLSSEYAL